MPLNILNYMIPNSYAQPLLPIVGYALAIVALMHRLIGAYRCISATIYRLEMVGTTVLFRQGDMELLDFAEQGAFMHV